jgi:hypothetical protein
MKLTMMETILNDKRGIGSKMVTFVLNKNCYDKNRKLLQST